MFKESILYLKKNPLLLLIIVPAWILTLLPTFFDGQYGCVRENCGYIFGSNLGDGSWYKAVSATSFQTIPFQMPNFAGETLKAYHYLPNLMTFGLLKLGIPIDVTYHKLIPIIYLSLSTVILIALGRKMKDSAFFVGLILMIYFFGMHLSLFTSLYHTGEIRNGALINTFQATRILESPHVALALCGLFFVILRLLTTKKSAFKDLLMNAVILFLIVGTKFYVAFSLAIILGVHGLIEFLKTRNNVLLIQRASIYGASLVLGIFMFYDPVGTTSSGSVFIFSPFSTVHHLIESPDLFYNQSLVLARYFLEDQGLSPRLVGIYLFSAFLFLLYYLGVRLIGLLYFARISNIKKLNSVEIGVAVSIFLSLFMSIMFIQKGDWFNPIQFAVPAAYLLVIFAAKTLDSIRLKHKLLGGITIFLAIIITLPAHFVHLWYLQNPAREVIPAGEMEALEFLKKQTAGAIFVPIQQNDTTYVSAYSEKPLYANYLNAAGNAGIDYEERKSVSLREELPPPGEVRYYYFPKATSEVYNREDCIDGGLEVLVNNDDVTVCSNNSI